MANLKEIRGRIESVTSTRQITNAMKMVSAAKLRKAQDAIIQMRPYAFKLYEILHHCQMCNPNMSTPYYSHREIRKVLIVVIASNKGLCGHFNVNISKTALNKLNTDYLDLYQKGKVDIICIGSRAADYLSSEGIKIKAQKNNLLDNLNFLNTLQFSELILRAYKMGVYDKIELIYNQFKNAVVQKPTIETLLPIPPPTAFSTPEEIDIATHNFIVEPSGKILLNRLIPKVLKTEFYKALLESTASEFGARMSAMHQATDNANHMIKELRKEYNKVRQTGITNEILEIVGGAEGIGN